VLGCESASTAFEESNESELSARGVQSVKKISSAEVKASGFQMQQSPELIKYSDEGEETLR